MAELDSSRKAYMAKRESAQFDLTCTIQQRGLIHGPQGPAVSYTNRATNVPCMILGTGRLPVEKSASDTVKGEGHYQINLPQNQTVAVTDRIVIGSRTFEVEQVPALSIETVVVTFCSEVV